MAAKPLTSEAIALAEKKMDMTLLGVSVFYVVYGMIKVLLSSEQGTLARRRSNFKANQSWELRPLERLLLLPFVVEPLSKVVAGLMVFPTGARHFWAGAPTIQKNPVNGGGFTVKKSQQQTNIGPMQNHQTLDSLFANMKEERKRVLSQQNNWSRRNGGDQPRVPWARGHMRN
ncbi:UNVERIFIED_CONTAM: hypothetical protein Scaly_2998000 [Sesamum calycinum]|uniref:Uncharacterized protein n=1 Tax=Sesamum calycinum TaxID=2727403 RepID=A0AAW2KEJ3_9LAMI